MKGRLFTFLAAFCAFAASLQAQAPATNRIPGELIIRLSADATLPGVISQLNYLTGAAFREVKTLSKPWRIHLLAFDDTAANPAWLLARVRSAAGVGLAQFNHEVQYRDTEPNDPQYWRQDNMNLIGMPDAWDASTGGLTPAGDTIVVAVLEKYLHRTHPELISNTRIHWAEIPGDDEDNDGNGYADDHLGWDVRFGADGFGEEFTDHGTSVCGIIGAEGNNSQGVTGVNWSVKMLSVTNVKKESEIIEAYNYVGDVRRLYNESNGAQGDFVVTTNASFGIDFAKAEDHPVWCEVYNELGELGIVSVGATANSNIDVDDRGDMPSTCESNYLITVNNLSKLGVKVPATGYGAQSIDLGAPGQDTYTLVVPSVNNVEGLGTIGGTSAATPHVTGAVALLYSLDCAVFTSDALSNPGACALRVRRIILENVEPESSLEGITTTGGRLNVANAVEAVRNLCGSGQGPLEITRIDQNLGRSEMRVYYLTPTFLPYDFRIVNMLGQVVYEKSITPSQFSVNVEPFDLKNLSHGMYFVSIGRGRNVVSKKFVKI